VPQGRVNTLGLFTVHRIEPTPSFVPADTEIQPAVRVAAAVAGW
jgi:hypothetical protein